jgi:hypothetical protein
MLHGNNQCWSGPPRYDMHFTLKKQPVIVETQRFCFTDDFE